MRNAVADTQPRELRLSRRGLVVGSFAWATVALGAPAETPVRAFSIRGLTSVLSGGMITLNDELNAIPAVSCTLEDHGIFYCENADRIADTAAAAVQAGQKLALIGHSFGGDCAVRAATRLAEISIPVALLIAIDANWFTCPPVPANVAIAMSFHQESDPIGRQILEGGPGFAGRLIAERVDVAHLEIDKSAYVHQRIAAAVRELTTANPNGPKRR